MREDTFKWSIPHLCIVFSFSYRHGLKVREHSVLGPYVDGLSQLAVISYQVSRKVSSHNYLGYKINMSSYVNTVLHLDAGF